MWWLFQLSTKSLLHMNQSQGRTSSDIFCSGDFTVTYHPCWLYLLENLRGAKSIHEGSDISYLSFPLTFYTYSSIIAIPVPIGYRVWGCHSWKTMKNNRFLRFRKATRNIVVIDQWQRFFLLLKEPMSRIIIHIHVKYEVHQIPSHFDSLNPRPSSMYSVRPALGVHCTSN